MKRWLIIFLLVASPAWGSISLNGGDDGDRLSIFDDATLDVDNFTVSLWLKARVVSSWDGIISKADVGTSTGFNWVLRFNASSGIQGRFYSGGTAEDVASSTTSWSSWTHVALVHDGTNLIIYVNGTAEDTNSALAGSPNTGSEKIFIGVSDNGGIDTARSCQCDIDEVAIWNNDLTSQEIMNLSKSRIKRMPYQLQSSALVMYLSLDEDIDGSALSTGAGHYQDFSENTNNATGTDSDGDADNLASMILSYP